MAVHVVKEGDFLVLCLTTRGGKMITIGQIIYAVPLCSWRFQLRQPFDRLLGVVLINFGGAAEVDDLGGEGIPQIPPLVKKCFFLYRTENNTSTTNQTWTPEPLIQNKSAHT